MNDAAMTPEAKRTEAHEIAAKVRAEREARFPGLGAYTPHPALAAAVPWMTDDEFTGLVWSIKRTGLLDPIVVDGDTIIDGRCRLVACGLAGVEPRFKPFQYDGDPAAKDDAIRDYIFRVNFMRQSLGRSQRLVYEAQIAALYPDLADLFHDLSEEAQLIVRYPDIAEQVTKFGLPLAEAYDRALERGREEERRAAERQRLDLLRVEAPFAAALVDEGTLTLEQGLAHAEEVAAAPLLAEHVLAIRTIGRRMMADALEIGRRLAECRRIVRRDWIGWLDRELGLTDRSALNFIRIHELAASRSENFADLDLPVSGLYLLAQPSTSEAIRDDVLGRAAAGEVISFSDIRRELSGETPEAAPLSGLAKIAARLREERPDDPLVDELGALVLRMAAASPPASARPPPPSRRRGDE
jgi:ParB-like chromosome segregation protein Spo0J